MKRALNLLAIALLASAPVFATDPTDDGKENEKLATAPNVSRTKAMGVAIYQSIHTTKMNLLIENYIEVPLKVSLLNEDNEVLHSEKVSKRLKTYWRKFEMATMKDGLYTFEVSDGFTTVRKSFRIDTPKVEVKQPDRFVSLLN
ncbi:hypothetical protein [Larkinella soli]|uniref:hypothetical protein n=1 Tax=Larkinella soli TaxID=1770527 RepID=UPI000FFBC31D|nr:hypothetical protein [Larkinella soli]